MTLATMNEYLTTAEAAELSGYVEEHVRRLVRSKKAKATLKGGQYWIDSDSLRAYLAEVKEQGTQRFNWRREAESQ